MHSETSLADPLLWMTAAIGLLGLAPAMAAVAVAVKANAKSNTAKGIAEAANTNAGQARDEAKESNRLYQRTAHLSMSYRSSIWPVVNCRRCREGTGITK